jgi:hypothetical protein
MRQAMKERHTVRQFDGTPLTDEEKSTLQARVDELNKTYDLDIALIESEKSPLSFLGKTLMSGKEVHSYFSSWVPAKRTSSGRKNGGKPRKYAIATVS